MSDALGKRAIRAAAFVVFGYGFSQVIRLAGNLVLARLLAPDLFGMMALAQVFYMGLGLLSDIGLEPAIIRSRRSVEPIFLNTAWTLQVIRGFILWGLAAAIAFPVARFYQEPTLVLVVPAIGLNSILIGLKSTTLVIMDKELRQGKLTYIDLAIQIVSLGCTILAAFLTKSIWSLVIGGLVASAFRTVWSHLLKSPVRNRFAFEKPAMHEVLAFGKWVLFSTAMMFFASQADRLLLGRIFPSFFWSVQHRGDVHRVAENGSDAHQRESHISAVHRTFTVYP
jgi:O-antigen/teichoic acid export membrane protein